MILNDGKGGKGGPAKSGSRPMRAAARLFACLSVLPVVTVLPVLAQTDPRLVEVIRHAQEGQSDSARIKVQRLLAATSPTDTLYPQIVYTQFGTNVMLTNAMIGDETGKVKLCLWGEQANVAFVGDVIQIKNASVRTYNGERQLNLGQTGTLTVIRNNGDRTKHPSEGIAKNPSQD